MGLFGPRLYEAFGWLEQIDADGTLWCSGVNAKGKAGSAVRVYQQLPGNVVDTDRFLQGEIVSVTDGGYGLTYKVRFSERAH